MNKIIHEKHLNFQRNDQDKNRFEVVYEKKNICRVIVVTSINPKHWTKQYLLNGRDFQKNGIVIVEFPKIKIGKREQAVRRLRSTIAKALHDTPPHENGVYPIWRYGEFEISLSRPNESPICGRWNLNIWTSEKKTLNVSWSPNDDRDLTVVSFRRGNWEDHLINLLEGLQKNV